MAREFAKKFYKSKEWKECREYIFERDKGLCQECLKKGKAVPGEEVHHIKWLKPSNINDPYVTLNPYNLELVCRDCHFDIHKSVHHNLNKRMPSITNGTYFDDKGNLHKVKVYLIYGAPGSGKTSYVKAHKEYGDLVVDLDLIKQALSMDSEKEQPSNLLGISKEIRDILYEKIRKKEVTARNIWVIASLPKKKERMALRSELDAELIFIDEDLESCIAHVMNDPQRKDKAGQVDIINEWFGWYER